jgi:hypothetical protein
MWRWCGRCSLPATTIAVTYCFASAAVGSYPGTHETAGTLALDSALALGETAAIVRM